MLRVRFSFNLCDALISMRFESHYRVGGATTVPPLPTPSQLVATTRNKFEHQMVSNFLFCDAKRNAGVICHHYLELAEGHKGGG